MLAKIFVCITFAWDPTRLVELEANLAELHLYPSSLTVRLVTNQVQQLGRALAGPFHWLQTRIQNLQVTGPQHELSHPPDLTHWHRGLMTEAFADSINNYTLFLYLVSIDGILCCFAFPVLSSLWHPLLQEHDVCLPFPALQAWAVDHQLLQQHSEGRLQRSFFRTEVNSDGTTIALDARKQHNFSHMQHFQLQQGPRPFFVALDNPYTAMWIADRPLLSRFMASELWHVHTLPAGGLGVQETAANAIMFLDPPAGFQSAFVVPCHPVTKQPLPIAALRHLSNKYANTGDPETREFGNVRADDMWLPVPSLTS